MRITNQMTANTVMLNINRNMSALDRRFQQLATGREIQFASQNPILASRTLKFRTTLAENEQFQRNLNQGTAFMEVSENAINMVNQMMQTVRELTVQGASDTITHEDRKAIALNISSLMDEIGLQMNQTYAGRNIFTGLRTDQPAVFQRANSESFRITQHFNATDIQPFRALAASGPDHAGGVVDAHRLILPYSRIDNGSIWFTPNLQVDGVDVQITHMNSRDPGAYEPLPNQIIYIEDTGELIFGSDVMDAINELDPSTFSIAYNKTGFSSGDLNPKVYFDSMPWDGDAWRTHFDTLPDKMGILMGLSTSLSITLPPDLQGLVNSITPLPTRPTDPAEFDPNNQDWINYYNTLERNVAPILIELEEFIRDYVAANELAGDLSPLDNFVPPETRLFTMNNQDMQFEFGVGIRISVNSLAKNIYTPEMHATFRDFTGFIKGINISSESELRNRFSGSPYNLTGSELDNRISSEISQQELHARAVSQARFDNLLESIDGFQANITAQMTDMGARMSRLHLIEDRLQDDNLSFQALLSQNEDADMAEVVTRLSMLQAIYETSLHVGMNIMQTTLLDFLR